MENITVFGAEIKDSILGNKSREDGSENTAQALRTGDRENKAGGCCGSRRTTFRKQVPDPPILTISPISFYPLPIFLPSGFLSSHLYSFFDNKSELFPILPDLSFSISLREC